MLRWLALLLVTALSTGPAHPVDRTIYRCVLEGVSTYSDRPCGESIVVYSLDVPTAAPVAQPARIPSVPGTPVVAAKPVRAPSTGNANSANHKDSHAKECVRLDTELRRLTARMRAGYSAAEGERLRERQRAARERRRDLQCRR